MANKNNTKEKATIQKLYDEIIPIVTTIAGQTVELKDIKDDLDNIKYDMKSKISIKAFISWLSALSIVIGIVITIISMR